MSSHTLSLTTCKRYFLFLFFSQLFYVGFWISHAAAEICLRLREDEYLIKFFFGFEEDQYCGRCAKTAYSE